MADKTHRDAARQALEPQKQLARMGIDVKLRLQPLPDHFWDPAARRRGEDLAPHLEALSERHTRSTGKRRGTEHEVRGGPRSREDRRARRLLLHPTEPRPAGERAPEPSVRN